MICSKIAQREPAVNIETELIKVHARAHRRPRRAAKEGAHLAHSHRRRVDPWCHAHNRLAVRQVMDDDAYSLTVRLWALLHYEIECVPARPPPARVDVPAGPPRARVEEL
eukprot:4527906-Prymnesium_polylepis.1